MHLQAQAMSGSTNQDYSQGLRSGFWKAPERHAFGLTFPDRPADLERYVHICICVSSTHIGSKQIVRR